MADNIKVIANRSEIVAIADAVRSKTGITSEMTLSGIVSGVNSITTQPTIQSLSITENGTYTAPTGVDGYSPITVNVESSGGAEMISGQISTGAETFIVHFTDESGYHRIEDFVVRITCPKDSIIFIENSSSYAYGMNMTGAEIVYVHTYEEYVEVIDGYETRADLLVRVKNDGFGIYP